MVWVIERLNCHGCYSCIGIRCEIALDNSWQMKITTNMVTIKVWKTGIFRRCGGVPKLEDSKRHLDVCI